MPQDEPARDHLAERCLYPWATLPPHGTKRVEGKQHPVLDLAYWESKLPLGEDRDEGDGVDGPGAIAAFEQARRVAARHGALGPSVPVDMFTWSYRLDHRRPWLTKIGGKPWREKDKPWPEGEDGRPLHFLGQICLADSTDLLSLKLPGEVLLFYGRWDNGCVMAEPGYGLEWSRLKLKEPDNTFRMGEHLLPFEYGGVIHRTVQYTDQEVYDAAFQEAGWKEGGWKLGEVQASLIGAYASLPQGWPFEEGDGCTLVATLSSYSFRGRWPLVDVPRGIVHVKPDGTEEDVWSPDGMKLGIGDSGAMWVYRDDDGSFELGVACE